jgi:uncharacterized cupin superfamily protein
MTDWYVLNARDAQWSVNELGWYSNFEKAERFPEFGINLNVLPPGKPMAMYHHEPYQEGFLVLDGDAVLIIDGEERPLRKWDYVHCPRDVPHVVVGAGEGALVLAVGSRVGPDGGAYPHEPLAAKYGASAVEDTDDPRVAYAAYAPPEIRPYPEGLLPD